MLIPGIVSVTFKTLDFCSIISLASESQLGAIEWSEGWHIECGNVKISKEIGRRTREAGLAVAAFGSYYKLGEKMDFLSRLNTVTALGTDTLRIWAGDKPSCEVDASKRRGMVKEARLIADIASDHGIVIACEWHRNTLTDTNESGLAFLEEVDRKNFRTLWQPSPDMCIKKRKEGLEKLGKRLVNFHVYQWNQLERLPLCDGKEEWFSYFSIPDPLIRRYALLEFVQNDSIKQFHEDARCLKEMLEIVNARSAKVPNQDKV